VVGHLTYIEERDWISRIRLVLEHGTERVFEPVDREAGFALFKGWTLDQLLGQVVKTMAKQGTHAVGPLRQFLPILDAP